MAAIDLARLQDVKNWVFGNPSDGQQPTTDDAILGTLITQTSLAVLQYLQRPNILSRAYSETRSGVGGCRMVMRQYPITKVGSVQIGNLAVPARPALTATPAPSVTFTGGYGYGYVLEEPWEPGTPGRPQMISVDGTYFYRGISNCLFTYTAGYQVAGEGAVTPASGSLVVQPLAPYGFWAADGGVVDANTGVALTPVASAPIAGQYVPPSSINMAPTLQYLFADAGRSVLLTYSYVPADIAFSVAKWVGESFTYRGRIGQKRKQLSTQETIEFQLVAMPDDVKLILQPYRRLVPV